MAEGRSIVTKARSELNIDWVEIPRGKFVFGLDAVQSDDLLHRLSREFPRGSSYEQAHVLRETLGKAVELHTFYVSRFPITWKQFLAFAESDHCYSYRSTYTSKKQATILDNRRRLAQDEGDHPADVSWHSALAFCDWIGARLPTSAEWEKAARGVDGHLYPWGKAWDSTRGNFNLDRSRWPGKTSPVDAYPSGQSPYGVMDMMGNTYEWTLSTLVSSEESVICRGCSCDFEPGLHTPDWFRNRVTAILPGPMNFGGTALVGFRPVLDEWHKKAWIGF